MDSTRDGQLGPENKEVSGDAWGCEGKSLAGGGGSGEWQ
jgi:hypothetical protein